MYSVRFVAHRDNIENNVNNNNNKSCRNQYMYTNRNHVVQAFHVNFRLTIIYTLLRRFNIGTYLGATTTTRHIILARL